MLRAKPVYRVIPRAFFCRCAAFDQGPQIDPTGHIAFERPVQRGFAKPRGHMMFKRGINQPQNRLSRAERIFQCEVLQRLAQRQELALELIFHTIKFGRVGALKRIDRLLFVTHHKDCPDQVLARAFATGKFLRQFFNHLPLHGAGILRLIHQNMVNATIKPVQHPLRQCRIG